MPPVKGASVKGASSLVPLRPPRCASSAFIGRFLPRILIFRALFTEDPYFEGAFDEGFLRVTKDPYSHFYTNSYSWGAFTKDRYF